jgi:xylan 1,4-beta-xylosidase
MIHLHPSALSSPFRHPWKNLITVGRAAELLRADLQAHVRRGQSDVGWKACRFHGIFHDDMRVVHRDANGNLHFCWTYVDQVIDFLLSVGLKPFLQFGAMPSALASGSKTIFDWKMNVVNIYSRI